MTDKNPESGSEDPYQFVVTWFGVFFSDPELDPSLKDELDL